MSPSHPQVSVGRQLQKPRLNCGHGLNILIVLYEKSSNEAAAASMLTARARRRYKIDAPPKQFCQQHLGIPLHSRKGFRPSRCVCGNVAYHSRVHGEMLAAARLPLCSPLHVCRDYSKELLGFNAFCKPDFLVELLVEVSATS